MGDRLFSWIDVDGVEWPLNDETNYLCIIGPGGLYGIPRALVTQDIPMEPGTTEKYVQQLPNTPHLPIVIHADTEEQLDTARRQLLWAMNANRGLGKIRHTSNDGVVRELNCRLMSGHEGDEGASNRASGALFVDFKFFAADPFWYDINFIQQFFPVSAGAALLDQPFLPVHLSPSGVASSLTLENTGEAKAWPIWTVTGPATDITFTNNTTGDVLHLPSSLMAAIVNGESITIDTSPGQRTILREDGSKHFDYMDPTSVFWGLIVGQNNIAINVSGNDSHTTVLVSYKQRYEGV